MTLPEKAPNMTTKASVAFRLLANVQSKKQSSDVTVVTTQWTSTASKRVERNAEAMRPIVEEAFMIAWPC